MNMIKKISMMTALFTSPLFAGSSPDWVHIEMGTYGGSGCPGGSDINLVDNDDPKKIEVAIEDIKITTERFARKNCGVSIRVDHPEGWQYAVKSFDTEVFSKLSWNANARLTSYAYFQGKMEQTNFEAEWTGRFRGQFEVHDTIPHHKLNWSSCHGESILNTNTAVRTVGGDAQVKLKNQLNFGLVWRQC